ncbi:MAG: DotG/IcmE/VirB10 family protein [Alphaproteobacteria bacterium]|nr:DotG/IcmE/VirB10 family protein [Alphaproteobacteria bacterium]
MSDNLDGDDLDLGEAGFDDFEKKGGTLGDLWRDNPLVKVGVVAVAIIVIFGGIVLFGGGGEQSEVSVVPSAPDIAAPPGTGSATPEYIEAIEEANEQRIEEAYKEGSSALPTPIDPPSGRLAVPEEDEAAIDPLQRWKTLQAERLERELQQQEIIEPESAPEDTARAEAIQALSELMSEQMSSILEKTSTTQLSHLDVTEPSALEELQNADADGDGEADEFEEMSIAEVLFPAGEIVYAQLLTEANTDVPGPVLAEIMSGPFKGYRVLGSFQENNELLTLNFDTIIIDGISKSIEAVALDPDTTLPGIATDVDHHYLVRVVMPIAAAFVKGVAGAIADTGRTTVTVEGETVVQDETEADTREEIAAGIEEAGEELGSILEDIAGDTEVTVRIRAGTPFGLLFLESVLDEEDT